ncbi:non-ribosomal peptide synthase/polyketide synthase [Rhodococcus ruber]|uniref:Non-ribosomal peptide synthase/polyketide synthase n=1 Tax=Rhodococcus ruber TaxID=1830 RepID=A0ABT4MLM9_9NOCA|nr:non-ribosomal peptide synthase/polyketide synthase [Rhodococcus ruber]MCZ4521275.1 non-ribosomal peptide synthase/polyketide synthase [Rhodococcus ruber]
MSVGRRGDESLTIEDLPRLVRSVAAVDPDRVALTHLTTELTYSRLDAEITTLDAAMGGVLGPDALIPVVLSNTVPGLIESSDGGLDAVVSLLVSDAVSVLGETDSASDVARPDADTLYSLFADQAERTPDAVALMFGDDALTYAQFASKVGQLARHLVANGVGPDARVGLSVRRSFELLLGMYAISAAGGAYVPLDPDHPVDRLGYVLDIARPVLVLTTTADRPELPDGTSTVLIDDLDVSARADGRLTDADRIGVLAQDDLAYVIFTSGSTGRPKGVAVSHRAIVANISWRQRAYSMTGEDVVLQKTPFTFDVSVWEFFWPLQIGATLVIAEPEGHRDPAYLSRIITERAVTVAHFVPSMLSVYVAEPAAAQQNSLRMVFASGEALPARTVNAFHRISGAALHNLYGPTEAAVDVTYYETGSVEETSVPIGAAVDDTELYVLDEALRRSPRGIEGELYLAGVQLARGYLGRTDLTSDRFVADPYGQPGDRMYRTGDLVRRRADGLIEYIGRTDFQVKLRGLRIELGEIESALLAEPEVTQAAVVVHSDEAQPQLGEHLVGYVVGTNAGIDHAELADAVRRRMPDYMVPSLFVVLDEFPLNSSGKLDRRALPAPDFSSLVREYRAPETETEIALAAIFGTVLGMDRIGVDDDFFTLGGNSLNATRVIARVNAERGVTVDVRSFFDAPTVAELAILVDAADGAGVRAPLVAQPRPERIPLSLAQQRMWFLNRFEPDSAVNNIPVAITLSGELDTTALRAAVSDLLDRHESLRTVYPDHEGVGYQQVLESGVETMELETAAVSAADVPATLLEFALRPFELSARLPVRALLLELSATEHVLAFVVHHIAADGFSMGPLTRDVVAAYLARTAGEAPAWAPLEVQYADFTLWQRAVLGSEDDPDSVISAQESYWRTQLGDAPDQLALPTDRPRPAVSSTRGGTYRFEIDADLAAALDAVAQAHNATTFMVVHAALSVLLAKLSAAEDITIGTPVAGRGDAVLDDVIGMFVNTLVLRTPFDPRQSFEDFLREVREVDLAAFAHADVPFERLVDVLSPARSQSRHPLFQVMLTFQNLEQSSVEIPGLRVAALDYEADLAKFDLQVTLWNSAAKTEGPSGLTVALTYAADLFDESTMALFGQRFLRVLAAITHAPSTALGNIEILGVQERSWALDRTRPAGSTVPASSIGGRFEAQVRSAPNAVAVTFGDSSLSYLELSSRANALARELVAAGAGPESLVAVALPRSAELVVALLAVLSSGAGYLPIDTSYPAERLEFIMSDAKPAVLLTNSEIRDGFDLSSPSVVLIDDSAHSERDSSPITDDERLATLHADNTAYVIYTSGSTGTPKGVRVSHRNVEQLLDNTQELFGFDSSDVWTMFHSFAFDFSVWELWAPLLSGGRVIVVDYFTSRSPEAMLELLVRERVTVLNQTPSAFYQLIDAEGRTAGLAHEKYLRYVIFGGEALDLAQLGRWYERHSDAPTLVNMYGITETTVHVSFLRLDAESAREATASRVGDAIPGLGVFVLDSRLRPVPAGVVGEMYVSGEQLALGYLERPDLSAVRFVAHPYGAAGKRIYRTGDLARLTASGNLEYVGRSDSQVQLRGFRIELGEVEAALERHDAVSRAVVQVRNDDRFGDRLIGYVVPFSGVDVDPEQLSSFVGRFLTDYMVPDVIVVLAELPLTQNGKLDRRALPEPTFVTRAFRAPSTPVEEIVARVFGDVLGIDRVGVDDDFFSLGGNSLVATQVVSRLSSELGTTVAVRTLFEASSVAAMAARVDSHVGSGISHPLVPQERPELVPLSLAQQRMWFLNRFEPESAVNNIPVAIRLSGALDIGALTAAVSDVLERHESLRTVYPSSDGIGHQVVRPTESVVPDLEPAVSSPDRVLADVVEFASAGFDVTAAVPLRARLFHVSDGEYVLVFVVHHISADGWSMGPLTRDVMTAYVARAAGEHPSWTALDVQYIDFALWQRSALGEEDDPESPISAQASYWRETLADLPAELSLPMDRARPAVQSYAGGRFSFEIDADVHSGLRDLARASNSTLFMVLHTALAVFLARMSTSEDIAIGTAVAGRGDAALDDVIGMFVNTLVLRTTIDSGQGFDELLSHVRDVDLAAFGHSDIPFERLVDLLDPERSTARHPLFQVAIALENLPPSEFTLPGLTVSGLDFDVDTAKFDLSLTLHEKADGAGLSASFLYARDLFDEKTVSTFARRFGWLLAAVVAAPSSPVGDLPILYDDEYDRLTHVHGDDVLAGGTMAEIFAAGAALDPEAIAIRYRGRSVSYAELDATSSQLARVLIERGAGPEAVVALGFQRSYEMVLAVWAVAKSGAAHMPIDPTYPQDRIGHMVSDSRAVLGLTVRAHLSAVSGAADELEWLSIDDDAVVADVRTRSTNPVVDADRLRPSTFQNPAYLIYTSGSTGKPKGVVVTHAGLGGVLDAATDLYHLSSTSKFLHICSPNFDPSVLEWMAAFSVGATLVIVPADVLGGTELSELLKSERVSHTIITPAVLGTMDPTSIDSLKVVSVGGDVTTPDLLARWAPGRRYFNGYGPTETTIISSFAELTPGEPVTIGRAIHGMSELILDSRLNPVPTGVAGELYLAGGALARGYLGRPALTAERFVANPYSTDGSRMYRTGDVVRWTDDLQLQFVGRSDFQVKVRGFRIELGEIDSALTADPGVEFAVTLGHELPSGVTTLVSYVLPTHGAAVDVDELTSFLGKSLPAYMIPSSIIVLDAVPLTPVGKLDRAALPEPVFEAREFRTPTTAVEEIVAGVFADVLNIDRAGLDDDFFSLGGNSLVATQVVSRLGVALDTVVPVRVLFEYSTVAALAVHLESVAGSGSRAALVAGSRPERPPLSLAQQRYWFLNQFDTSSAVDNIPFAVRLSGTLDVSALQAAVFDVLARHESLRTRYPNSPQGPYQQVLTPSDVGLDLNPRTVDEADIVDAVGELFLRGFDVTADVPVDARLFQVRETEHVLAFVVHHVSSDGASMGPLAVDVMTAYSARAAGSMPDWAPLPVQYVDYSLWQRTVLGSDSDPSSVAAQQVEFWKRSLADLPDQLVLPTDRPRPASQSFRGEAVRFTVSAEVHRALADIARSHNATLFMVVHSAFAVFLSRMAGTDDIAIGSPIAGRGESALDPMIGMFVNTLVFRSTVDPAMTFDAMVTQSRERDLAAFAHADIPFERLVEVLNPVRSTARNPLFQVGLSFQNLADSTFELPGLTVSAVETESTLAKTDLQLSVSDKYEADGTPGVLDAEFSFATDLFDRSTIEQFVRRFVSVLDAVATESGVVVGDLDLLDESERTKILRTWNATDHDVDTEQTLVSLFDAQVAAHPDSVVLTWAGESLSYSEFDGRVNRLARVLIDAGVGPQVPVALALTRSVELLVAMYAVSKAGGVYVPIDPSRPSDRVHHILEAAAPLVILSAHRDAFEASGDVPIILVDGDLPTEVSAAPVTNAERIAPLRAANTAYVIFTSGSTGEPKGVAVSHGAIVNQMLWQREHYGIGSEDVVLLKTAATFDLSVWEFWVAPISGGSIAIAEADRHRDADYLVDLMRTESVTTLHTVPSMLDSLIVASAGELPPSLRRILAIGEALPVATAERARRSSVARLDNLYGPTEAAVSVTSHEVAGTSVGSVSIGSPEWNTQVYVLDARLAPVPPGVAGELYLAGVQLAEGYFGRTDLTAERFVANPHSVVGGRMYRTGDLVRWAPNGELDYVGRTDFQVKIRGFRIELGDIDTALASLDEVRDVAVVATKDDRLGDRLVAYIVPSGADVVDADGLRDALSTRLPSYMVPSAFVILDALPLNANGKLDRKALPQVQFEVTEFRAPTNSVEEAVAGVFADVLGIDRVGLDDDFFALGGNSLIATQVVSRIGAALDTQVPVRAIFESSTVFGLARAVESKVGTGARRALTPRSRPESLPLSMAQQRMWFLSQFDPASAANNIPAAIRLTGTLDVDALATAVTDVVTRHEILRTVYPESDGNGRQLVLGPADSGIAAEIVQVDASEVSDTLRGIMSEGFDVTRAVPVRIRILEVSTTEHVLAFVAHHIAADGFSMGPLTRDIMVAYAARTAGESPQWSPLPVQYADYTLWQREVLGTEHDPESVLAQQVTYWQSVLAGAPAHLDLATDRPRPAVASYRGGAYNFSLSSTLHADVGRVARENNATVFMVTHTALAILLSSMAGVDDVTIGTPVAGRGDSNLDDLIGMFVNTLALRTSVNAGTTLREQLALVREADLGAFGNADVPFERLVDVLAPERSQSRHPIFQVMLTFQNLEQQALTMPGLTVEGIELGVTTAKFDLQVTLWEQFDDAGKPDGIDVQFDYATDLFDESTMAGLARRFVRVLDALTGDPHRVVGDVDILDTGERTRVLEEWNATDHEVDSASTLVSLFEARAASVPDRTALSFADESVTYGDFSRRVNSLARLLIAEGVGPETVVAVAMRRSVDMLVGIYAVITAGGAYVPIDPDQPADRIGYILAIAAPVAVLTTGSESLDASVPHISIDTVDIADFGAGPVTDDERTAALRPSDTAYVIFTSGSTGRPKGVAVSHEAIVNRLVWMQSEYLLGDTDVVLQKTPVTFDVSVWELFWPLQIGAELAIAKPDGHRDPSYLVDVIRRRGVTVAHFVPSLLAVFAGADGVSECTSLRMLFASGEALPASVASSLRSTLPVVSLHNLYGPTEAAVDVTYHEVTAADINSVPIGAPVWNTRVTVLDARLRPVPVGVPGELYLAGVQLARGYLGRPDLSADRFVANPYGGNGSRMYRTGDLVRWNANGELDYLGRTDFQVKLRGLRIELGEIEAALTSDSAVGQAVVLVRQTPSAGEILVGYVVPATGATIDASAVTATVAAAVPEYMVPADLIVLDGLPLGPNGKLDRRALPDPQFGSSAEFRTASSDTERLIAEVFADVLGLDSVGVDDSFFALGGDSIVSIQLVSRAKARGILFGPRDVFERKTVAGLAEVAVTIGEGADALVLEELDGGGVGWMPLPPFGEALTQRGGGWSRFHQAVTLELPVGIDRAGIDATLGAVIDHHDILRSTLVRDDRGWGLDVSDPGTVEVDGLIFAGETDTAAQTFETAVDSLDPDAGRMLAFVWIDRRDGVPGTLSIVAHHLVADGVSWRILVPDLVSAWAQISSGATPVLPAVGTSMRRWTHALRDESVTEARLTELPRWRQVAETPDPLLGDRPFDPAIDVVDTIERVDAGLTAEVTRTLLTTVPEIYRGGVADGLLAALALAVSALRAEQGLVAPMTLVQLEGHGREEAVVPGADLGRTVGWFTSLFPTRLDLTGIDVADALAGGPAIGAAVKAVKEQMLSVPDRGMGWGMLRYLNADTAVELAELGTGQISFNYLGRVGTGEVSEDVKSLGWLPTADSGELSARGDADMAANKTIDINAIVLDTENGAELSASFAFPRGAVESTTVERLAQLWAQALNSLAAHAATPAAGGLTPSDLPLVSVTQSDIEGFERRYPTVTDVWSLSPLQQGLLFHALFADASIDVYTMQVVLELGGDVDGERLHSAARALLDRHDNFRTSFATTADGESVQIVHRQVELPWATLDVTHLDGAERDAVVADALAEDQRRHFDVAVAPLLRFLLIRLTPTSYTLAMTNHHVLLDGWSLPLMMKELLYLYAVRSDTASMPRVRPYRSFLAWLDQQDESISHQAWADALDGVEEPTLIAPQHHGREISSRSAEARAHLDVETTAALVELGSRLGVTVNTLVQAAYGLLLSRMTGSDDVLFGATVSGRPAGLAGVESMIGLFINTIPVRVRIDPSDTVETFLVRIQGEQAALLEHHHIGLVDIQRTAGLNTLFDTLTVFESYPVDEAGLAEQAKSIDGLRVDGVRSDDNTHYPLTLLVEATDRISLTAKYFRDLFEPAFIGIVLERLERILASFVTDSTASVLDVSITDEAEQQRLLTEWNTDGVRVDEGTLVDAFEAQVGRTASAVAVSFESDALTYAELDARANRVARRLLEGGAGPEVLVAVALPRSLDMVVAILAVLKSGAAYLPLDVSNPTERNAYILGDARPAMIVSDAENVDAVTGEDNASSRSDVVLIDGLDPAEYDSSPLRDHERRGHLSSADIAYVIYTSGSTGRPKGVAVTHRNVSTLMANAATEFDVDSTDVWTMFHSYAFDFSVWELWGPLLSGGKLVVVDYFTSRSPDSFVELLQRERVTVLSQTPSAFYQLISADAASEQVVSSLRYVVFGGEALNPAQLTRWYERHADDSPRLVNMYGITETTVHVTFQLLNRSTAVDGAASVIGRGLPGLSVFALDTRLRPTPVGLPGEIYVAGEQLSRGYLGRPGLTATRFVANPNATDGSRMYRSGDIAAWNESGSLEYAGRQDSQVQLRGFRIELGEVEAALFRDDGIAEVVAEVRHSDVLGERLIAYVVPQQGRVVDSAEMLSSVGRFLTSYMVPDAIVVLEALPLTSNGKLDRRALPDPEIEVRPFRAPSNPVEEVVSDVFADVLGVERIGLDDDFFALGGNSLVATRLVARISSALGKRVGVRDLFEAPSVESLSARIESMMDSASSPSLVPVDRGQPLPLSLAQQRMWVINRLDPESGAYNIPLALRLDGDLDIAALQYAVERAIARHEPLRTRYPEGEDGTPYQDILGSDFAALNVEPIDVTSESDMASRIRTLVYDGFDVTTAPPVRGALLRLGENRYVLVIVVHHIAGDGASMRPLATDVMTAYVARHASVGDERPPLSVQYADFAVWQRQVLGSESDPTSIVSTQLAFWKAELSGITPVIDLPWDRMRTPTMTMRGRSVSTTLAESTHSALVALARESNATLFMVLHAVLGVLLSRMSGARDFAIGTPIAGRGEEQLDELVGMFVNTLALRTIVDPSASFSELVARLRANDLRAFENSDVPFERVVDAVAPDRAAGYTPLFQTVLSVEPLGDARFELPNLVVEPVAGFEPTAKFDLQVTVQTRPGDGSDGIGDLVVEWVYAADIFDEATVASLADRFVRIGTAVARDPAVPVGDIDDLDEVERAALAGRTADASTPVTARKDLTLPQLFSESVETDPDAPALSLGGVETTYRELDERSSRLARELISRGVEPGVVVAVSLSDAVDSIVARWAVAKSGGALTLADSAESVARTGAAIAVVDSVDAAPWAEALTVVGLQLEETVRSVGARSSRPVTYSDRTAVLAPESPALVVADDGRVVDHGTLAALADGAVTGLAVGYDSRLGVPSVFGTETAVLAGVVAASAGAVLVLDQAASAADAAEVVVSEWVTHAFLTGAEISAVEGRDQDDLTDLESVVVALGDSAPDHLSVGVPIHRLPAIG